MPDFIVELSGYYATGWVAALEKFMIFFMIFWIAWCFKLFYEADDGIIPVLNKELEE